MKDILLLFCCISLTSLTIGQTNSGNYAYFIKKADALYRAKDFKNSAINYSLAFKANDGIGQISERYNAACSWALANEPDSAFYQLYGIATKANYYNYDHVTTDSDLISLKSDKRWQPLLDIIKQNQQKAEAKLNKPLMQELDTIFTQDQLYRGQINSIEKAYGWNSKEMKAHLQLLREVDSINLVKVKAILDKYGWLEQDEVGQKGNLALFLVIQHSDLHTQEKYLPMMRAAVKFGKASVSNLALLEDRVAIGKGGRQLYGSQIGRDNKTGQSYVLPLQDPDNVDKRRMEVGLEPLANYVKQWNIKWDVEQYKKDLPNIEAKEKENGQ